MNEQTRTRIRLPLYFTVAIAVSTVCGFSLALTATSFFDIRSSIKNIIVGLILAALTYGSGGFVLGTLTRGLIGTWLTAIIYIAPSVLLRFGIFALAFVSSAVRDDLINKPYTTVVLPILTLILAPFVAFCAVRIGEIESGKYARPHSILNIPWYHWLWIIPFYLFQVVGVPSYLLLTLWWIDILMGNVQPSLLNLPSFIPRIIVAFILMGVCLSIFSVHSILSATDTRRGPLVVLKLFGNWFLLTAMEGVILLSCIGKFMK